MALDALHDSPRRDGCLRYPNGQPIRTNPITQLIQLQRRAIAATQDPNLKPSVLAGLMRSVALIDARICAHRMKPLPKSVDVTKWNAQRRRARAPETFAGTADDKESLSPPTVPAE